MYEKKVVLTGLQVFICLCRKNLEDDALKYFFDRADQFSGDRN